MVGGTVRSLSNLLGGGQAVHYLDCGDGFTATHMSQDLSNCTL